MRLRSKFLVVLLPVVLAGLTLQWVVSSYTQDRQMTGQRVALLSHILITPEPPLALVLRNLIDNAIQHHDQPTVTIDIHLSRQGRRVVFQVSDDGPGISPDEHVRLFALFGDRDRRGRGANRAGGCGIGLALVRRIVQRLGGSLELKSNETGRGTSAVFDWPMDCHMLPTLTTAAIRLPSSLVPAA